jgi:hypothetical protein
MSQNEFKCDDCGQEVTASDEADYFESNVCKICGRLHRRKELQGLTAKLADLGDDAEIQGAIVALKKILD